MLHNTSQQSNQQMEADNAKESLGLANFFLEQTLPKSAPQTQETAPGSEETLDLGEDTTKQENEAKMAEIETRLDEKLEAMKNELLEAINKKDKKE